jgi:predicted esterase
MSLSLFRALRRVFVVSVVSSVLLAGAFTSHAAAGTEASASASALGAHDRSAHTIDAHASAHRAGDIRGHYSSEPLTLHAEHGVDVLAFPPATKAESKPLTVVYLHGMHGRASNGCPWFRGGASELGWLVCPEAIEAQPDGSWSWGADVFKQAPIVDGALRAARENGASSEPGIAVGFSQGSYVALDLVKANLAHFRGLVLLGAELHPNTQRLKDAGIVRISLGAGQMDSLAYASLRDEAVRLSNEGIETRFFDLGHVGHTYVVEDTKILDDAIAFAAGG